MRVRTTSGASPFHRCNAATSGKQEILLLSIHTSTKSAQALLLFPHDTSGEDPIHGIRSLDCALAVFSADQKEHHIPRKLTVALFCTILVYKVATAMSTGQASSPSTAPPATTTPLDADSPSCDNGTWVHIVHPGLQETVLEGDTFLISWSMGANPCSWGIPGENQTFSLWLNSSPTSSADMANHSLITSKQLVKLSVRRVWS